MDNFLREGSRGNVEPLRKLGIRVEEGDIRNEADLGKMPKADWVLDCAAEPSVLAGVTGGMGSYELMDHNLIGTIRVLELCKKTQAGFILMSTSRVYSVAKLAAVKVEAGKIRIGDCGLAPGHPPLAHSKIASGLGESSLTRKELGIGGDAKAESGNRKSEKSDIVGLTSKGVS